MTEQTVNGLREALLDHTLDATGLVRKGLARIAERDAGVNAIIELNPDAEGIAASLDAHLRDGGAPGPLHGIPVLLKDNVATADGMQTTAGSLALVDAVPRRDAFIVTRLREAGAVILGKTNMSEWANIRSRHSISGWSGRGGQTFNPYQLDRNPSGSSSGSGAAVAAGYAPLAVGTETNGSIVLPAAVCGIVGIKPTVGLVSRSGVIPISHFQDTTGPMAPTVEDAALLLTVLAADDPEDEAQIQGEVTASPSYPARPRDWAGGPDYTTFLDADGLRGARIGVLRPGVSDKPPTDAIYQQAITDLRNAGAEIVDGLELPHAKELNTSPYVLDVMLWDFKTDLENYLAAYVDPDFPIRDLAGALSFNRQHADQEMPWFGQDLFELAAGKGSLDAPEYLHMVSEVQRWGREEGIDALLRQHRLDALIAPTNTPAGRIDVVNRDGSAGGSSGVSAVAGYPIVTVPAGYAHGLPGASRS
jgi:amidase